MIEKGDLIRRVASRYPACPLGYETVALGLTDDRAGVWYTNLDGDRMDSHFENWIIVRKHDADDVIIPSDATPRSIYLSGPMKGYPGSNYPLFNAVAEQLRRAGHRVYNPAEFGADRPFDGFPIRQAFAAYSKFICEEADAIVLLPGWEASKGANAERALADNCGIEIIPFDRLSTTITTEGSF